MPKTDLPKDVLELEQLLHELAPDLEVKPYRAGRQVQDEDGTHVLQLWRHDGRWIHREIVTAGRGTSYYAAAELPSVARLAEILARMLLLEPQDAETHLRKRAQLLAAAAEQAEADSRHEVRQKREDATQAAWDVVHRHVDLRAEPPYGPREGWQIARVEDVGEVAEWGPPLLGDPKLPLADTPTEPGWYAVRVVAHEHLLGEEVERWGPLFCEPCTLPQLLAGFEGGGDDA